MANIEMFEQALKFYQSEIAFLMFFAKLLEKNLQSLEDTQVEYTSKNTLMINTLLDNTL